MRVLVLNPGSATLKYSLMEVSGVEAAQVDGGLVDHVSGGTVTQAAEEVLRRLGEGRVDAIGCRVVHGGSRFAGPTRVTAEVNRAIRELGRLAPLHNPIAADMLEAVLASLPNVPVFAVFDTAFHTTLPETAWHYAIPDDLTQRGVRRYGFHGTSHSYVSRRLSHLLKASGGREPASAPMRLITCHLGNGASVCAVRDGKSIDTSMGLTPLEGLVMGTRSGDLGPDVVLHLIRREGLTAEQLDELLNRQSGLLGLCGDADMRAVQTRAASGDARALLALDVFCYRLRKYIGAYAAALEGVDAIAFTGGIGEHSAEVRERVCRPLAWLGVQLDEGANRAAKGEVRITLAGSPVQAWVVPTDEEREIAVAVAGAVG
jgi:acetate kinase